MFFLIGNGRYCISNKGKYAPPFTSARGQDDLNLTPRGSNCVQEVSSSYGQEAEDEHSFRDLSDILLEKKTSSGKQQTMDVPTGICPIFSSRTTTSREFHCLVGKQSPDGCSSSALDTTSEVHDVLSTSTKFWCFVFSYEAGLPLRALLQLGEYAIQPHGKIKGKSRVF